MLIIGCDFHPGFQQLAIFDKPTGEISYRRLRTPEEAGAFFRGLEEKALLGLESCGFSQCQKIKSLSARSRSCPDTKPSVTGFFSGL